MERITISTDGSCHGNPGGPGGYAAIIEIPQHSPLVVRGGHPETTNNRMELTAVIEGLRELRELANVEGGEIEVRSDSTYVINAFRKGWQRKGWRKADGQPVLNPDLWQRLLPLTEGVEIIWTHVRGHAGDSRNEECDLIANQEAERAGRTGTENRESPVRYGTPTGEVQERGTEAGNSQSTGKDHSPGHSQDYARGYAAGYEDARRDMANALNAVHPDQEALAAMAGDEDDLHF